MTCNKKGVIASSDSNNLMLVSKQLLTIYFPYKNPQPFCKTDDESLLKETNSQDVTAEENLYYTCWIFKRKYSP